MWYIKNIKLKNFMGYKNIEFDFLDKDGNIKDIYLIYAANGSGKSSLLNAINLVYNSPRLTSRDSSLLFRKLVYNENYDPHYQALLEKSGQAVINSMYLDAILINTETKTEGKVIINNNGIVETCLDKAGYGYFIDADNPINLTKFQIAKADSVKFLELAKIIYNFDCEFKDIGEWNKDINNSLDPVNFNNVMTDIENLGFLNDFIINKYGVKVHYKSFSGGEKKLATMLSQVCDSNYINNASAVIIDSFEKEIYYKRQTRTVDRMLEYFPNKQWFIVTHSETLIKHVKEKYGEQCLYDIEKYKKIDLGIESYNN